MTREIDEDLIEATIRRVAESKAAREGPTIEMPVAEAIAPNVEKFPIELALERAERSEQETADDEPAHTAAPVAEPDDDDDIDVTPTPLMAASRGRSSLAQAMSTTPDSHQPPASSAMVPRPMREPVRARPAEQGRGAVAAREPVRVGAADDDGGAIAAQLSAIQHQLDEMMAVLRRLSAGSGAPSIGPAWEQAAAATAAQRPPIFRDDALRAPAVDVDPDVIDTRPIPKPLPPIQVEPKRGFDLLPRSYRITVEDKRRGVDLVPLHRAMLSMDGVRDMSLLSYNNGVAIVALEMTEELNPDALGDQVARAMARGATVEVHNEHTMVVKLADE